MNDDTSNAEAIHYTPISPVRQLLRKTLLRKLVPLTLEPARISYCGRSLLQLKKIETIELTLYDGRNKKQKNDRVYSVKVYMQRTQNRIPTNTTRRLVSSANSNSGVVADNTARRPNVCVQRTLTELRILRWRLYDIAYKAHATKTCQFCSEIMQHALIGFRYPNMFMRWLFSDESITASLGNFLNELLQLTLNCSTSAVDGTRCSGQESIPQVVFEFLLEQDELQD